MYFRHLSDGIQAFVNLCSMSVLLNLLRSRYWMLSHVTMTDSLVILCTSETHWNKLGPAGVHDIQSALVVLLRKWVPVKDNL